MAKLNETKSGETKWHSTEGTEEAGQKKKVSGLTSIVLGSVKRGAIGMAGTTTVVALYAMPIHILERYGNLITTFTVLGAVCGAIEGYLNYKKYKEQ